MGTRKSFGPHRREKKFFIVGTKGAGQDYWTFYTSFRFVDRHPGKAKRFYSKKAASAFKSEADGRDNPNMIRVVLKAVETEKGIDIHVPTSAHRKNPAPSPASRSAKFHRLRANLLTQLQIAKRKGSFVMEQLIGQKLRKLDRMFYAPRTIKRRK